MFYSIIIPSYNSAATIRACLDSVFAQKTDLSYEVFVSDSSIDATPEIIRNEYPLVKLIHFQEKTDPGTARNAAIKQSCGDIILFTDSDCVVASDWLSNIAKEHNQDDSVGVIGGTIINGNPQTLASIAGYYIEFSEYMPSVPEKMINSIPTSNISFKREIFEKYGFFQGKYYPQEDYLFNWNLSKAGEKIKFCPKIKVKHFHRTQMMQYLKHNYRFGTITARVLKITDLPGSFFVKRPWLAVFFLPFLPLIKFIRTCVRVLRFENKAWQKPLVFPTMLLGLLIWGAGFIYGTYTNLKGKK